MKAFLTMMLAAGVPSLVLAQAPAHEADHHATPQLASFGVQAGLTWGDLQSTSQPLLANSFERLRTFHAGGYYQRKFTRFAAVQVELLYSRKGYQGDGFNHPAGADLPTNRLSYLALPLLLVGELGNTFSLHLGPQAAVLLEAQADGQGLDLARSGYRRVELGTVGGAEARVGPAHIGVRADYSLTALNRAGQATTAAGQPLRVLNSENDYHNLVVQAYLRVGFER